MASLLIYGATRYTGRLIVGYAKGIGVQFLIAGRNEKRTKAYAATISCSYRVFDVNTSHGVDAGLKSIKVLLNCAGPFLYTAKPFIEACQRSGVRYLDTATELNSYNIAQALSEEGVRRNVMILPGCGGSVTMLEFLVRHALKYINRAQNIDMALHVCGPMPRRSAISAKENMSTECLGRSGGILQRAQEVMTAMFDFADGRGAVASHQITLPDIVTLWTLTGVENIRTFVNISGDAFPSGSTITSGLSDSRAARIESVRSRGRNFW